ncbi:ABC transporter substrate-binding protein [Halobacillus campisalis]|uniref:ABC transporter substrate-binding protein n=1 Tax=Halobacillus campisalis TaxID=435909 RepID=A0ABW2K8Y1_9BACI|nr:ABC transporter substrate-binding protein [Halobacillus campisalis]
MKNSLLYKRLLSVAFLLLVLAACADASSSEGDEGSSDEDGGELQESKLITNWFAQPEHGGNYAALEQGMYEDEGLDMEIEPGGPQVSTTQMVAAGEADFGYTQGEDILNARNKGIPLVAIGAIFQESPYVFISHADAGVEDFEDLSGKTVITAPGVGYWEYIKEDYDLEGVKEISYTGELSKFIDNPDAVTQGYVTSEPHVLEKEGVETNALPIHDSGFQPYSNVIFTTEKMIEENPEKVQAFMDATHSGWEYYRENSEDVQSFLQEYNPDLTEELMTYGAEAQEELIFGGEAEEHGFGYMSEERWSTLQEQMLELEIITNEEDPSNYYTTEFLSLEE